jgi:hypothetical protein
MGEGESIVVPDLALERALLASKSLIDRKFTL